MIVVISPSKLLDFKLLNSTKEFSKPIFQDEASALMKVLAQFRPEEIMQKERLSAKIALSAFESNQSFLLKSSPAKQAIFAYNGNVYGKLNASTLSDTGLDFAQHHLFILSALYGILKPLDQIKPYRLDMGSKLVAGLHDRWKEMVSTSLAQGLKKDDMILVNLASAEYFKLIDTKLLPSKTRIITPVFQQEINGKLVINSMFAKQARGLMLRFILENALTDPEYLKAFDSEGYYFNPHLSKKDHWHFTR